MNSGMKIMEAAAGFFGSVLMLLGIILLFLVLIAGSMVDNIDKFDESAAASMRKFVDNNREEIREYALDELEKGGMDMGKEQIEMLCANSEMLDESGEQWAALKDSLGESCEGIETATEEEAKARFVDTMIESNIDSILSLPQTGELKKAIAEKGYAITGSKWVMIGSTIGLYLLGILFTFAGVGFMWKKGLYKVCIKTGIRLASVALMLFLFSLVSSDMIIDTMHSLESKMPEMAVENAPPMLLNLIATVILDWVKLSTNPYIFYSLAGAVPFIIIALILRATILKLHKKKEEEKTVV